jgi:hypothetical protein
MRRAPGKSVFSSSSTKVKTSPPWPQPWQYRLFLLVDREAGRLLLVEGAEADPLAPLPPQPDVLLRHLDKVQAGANLVTRILGARRPR